MLVDTYSLPLVDRFVNTKLNFLQIALGGSKNHASAPPKSSFAKEKSYGEIPW